MKTPLSLSLFTVFFLAAYSSAFAVNDVTISDITNFDLNTADTAAATTITASAGGLVTQIDANTNYIDVAIDNASTVTFNTTVGGNYLKVTRQSGSTDYTLAPSCPTTTAAINGTGAQVVLRVQVYTTDQCSTTTPHTGGGGSGGPAPWITTGGEETEEPLFIDIKNHWAFSYINEVYNQGYILGYDDKTFRPDQSITRAEASKIIALWFDKNIEYSMCNGSLYTDVSCDSWYGRYVTYLSAKGVISGYGEGLFGPDKNISRAEAVKLMLYAKELQNTDYSDVLNPFSDVLDSDWFFDEVMIGYKLGIILGYNDGTFQPNNPVTRAEFTKIFSETFL